MHVPKRIRPQFEGLSAKRSHSSPQSTFVNPQKVGRETTSTRSPANDLADERTELTQLASGEMRRGYRPQAGLSVDAVTTIPTEHGTFQMFVFRWLDEPHEHVAMVRGDVHGQRGAPVRVHSECLTSEVFHSLKCDCREQLHTALDEIASTGSGVVLYLRQEGRGIGLANKVRAYALQSRGADTVDANRMLGLPDDSRRYDMAAAMLAYLGVTSVKLLTNNPQKVEDLRALGVTVDDCAPVLIAPNPHSAGYLEAKRVRMRHMLPIRPIPSSGDAE